MKSDRRGIDSAGNSGKFCLRRDCFPANIASLIGKIENRDLYEKSGFDFGKRTLN